MASNHALEEAGPGPPPARSWRASLGRRLSELTLLQRLLLMETLFFLAAFLGVLCMIRWYADGLTKRIEMERFQMAQAFAGQVDYALAHAFDELQSAGLRLQLDASGALDQVLHERFFSAAFVLGADDQIVAADVDHSELIGQRLPVDTRVTLRRASESFAWGTHTVGSKYLLIAVPAELEGQPVRVGGLLSLTEGRLADVLTRAVAITQTGHAELVDEDARAIFTTEAEHAFASSDHPSFYLDHARHGVRPGTYEVPHEEPGEAEPHVMAFVPLELLPWTFALGGTASDTFAPVATLWRAFYGLTSVAGTLAVLATMIGAPRLTQPVRELSDAARRVAGGELETRITVASGGEIGELGRSVETMRRSLYDWGVTLDQRVSERTQEIEARSLELAASVEVARLAGSTFEVEPMLHLVADYLSEVFGARGTTVYIPVRHRRPWLKVASSGLRVRPDVLQCEACMLHGGDAIVTMDPADARFVSCLEPGHEPFEAASVLRVPIPLEDGQQGALCLLYGVTGTGHRPTTATLQLLVSAISFGVRNSDLYQDVRQREAQARLLVGKVLTAQEEERRRVARELHDDAGQSLAGLMFGLDALERMGPSDGAAHVGQLASLRTITRDAIDNLRRTISALRPPALDDLGMKAAIMRYADLHARPAGITVTVSGEVDAARLGPDGEVAVFRIVQESLNNVIRHSGADTAHVTLRHLPDDAIEIVVRDNGRGFDVDAARRADAVGIYGMVERAEMLGGHLAVVAQEGEGTAVHAVIPMPGPGLQEPWEGAPRATSADR